MTPASTTVLLIRHAHTDVIGLRLVGRLDGVPLSRLGMTQAEELAARLAGAPLAAVYTSPLTRARQTAEAIARSRDLTPGVAGDLIEVDFGDWTGLTFEALAACEDWQRYNAERATGLAPGGEAAIDVQRRILRQLRTLHAAHAGETIAAVSHADVIRAALLHFLGMSLNRFQEIAIDPASVSSIALREGRATVLTVNETGPAR